MNSNSIMIQSKVIDHTPLADFSKIDREGIVTVRPMNSSEHKNESVTFSGFKGKLVSNQSSPDQQVREQRYWFGIPIKENPDGTFKFKKITIIDGRMYHLQNHADAVEWHIVKHLYNVEGSPNLMGLARWKVEEEIQTASKAISKGASFVKVFEFLSSMDDAKMKSFGRLFKLDPTNNTAEIIKGQLVKRAMDTPEIFVSYMEDRERTARYEIFKRAESMGVLTFTVDKGFLFMNSIPIGINEHLAMEYISKNKDMLVTMDIESRRRENPNPEPVKEPVLKIEEPILEHADASNSTKGVSKKK